MRKTICKYDEFKLWLILMTVLSLVFAHYMITFFWGNHDWDWVKGTTQVLSLNTGMFEGRYAKFILNVALFGGQILPVLNTLGALSLLALGGVLLTKYWQIEGKYPKIIVALVPLTAPFMLGWLYFSINILGNFAAVALVCAGLYLSEKKKIIHQLSAVMCFLIALGVYPSVMEMMIICFCFRWILKPAESKQILQALMPLVTALVLFKILLMVLGYFQLVVTDYYNLKTVSATELFERIPNMIKLAFGQLVTTLPFIGLKSKILGLIVILTAVFTGNGKLRNIALWVAAFVATVLSTWLTGTPEETAYMPRVNFYGLNFFYAGAMAVLLQNKSWKRNIGYVFGVILISQSLLADINAQKVWSFGKKAEEQLVERISSRIDAKISDRVVPVIAGTLPLRPRYYNETYQIESPYLLNASFMVRHIPSGMFNFYAVKPLFYGQSQISEISAPLYDFLRTAKRPYPALESVYVNDLYAVILLTPDGIASIQAQMPN